MKKAYFFFICFLYFQSLSATHILGGEITYEYLGGNEYKISLEVLRDCYYGAPGAYFDDPAYIGVFDENNNLVDSLQIPYSGIDDTISINVPNNICNFPTNVCVHKTLYEENINLPDIPGGYTIAYQRCCRSELIINLVDPLNTGMTFFTHIDPSIQNSSPQFNNNTPFTVFVNTPFVYDASAIDLNGDSLVYELSTPFDGASADNPQPEPSNPPPFDPLSFVDPTYSMSNMLGGDYPLTINAENGEMVAIPPTVGVFQIAYKIKEFRDGEHIGTTNREFAFVVIPQIENQNYDISGAVLVNESIPLDIGKVQILERNISTDSIFIYEEQVVNEGAYSFENIPAGVFYLKAIPDSTSMYFDNYLPTYYSSDLFWYEADPINQCDTSQLYRDINLLHVDSLMGEIILNGFVFNEGILDEPVLELNLILADENGVFIQARTTNSEGHFKFENLEAGTYFLHTDLINSLIDNLNPPIIDLNDNNTVQLYLYADHLSIEPIMTNVKPLVGQNDFAINLFPNPTKDRIVLDLDINKYSIYTLKIYDVYGHCLMRICENKQISKGEFINEIDLNGFSEGVYFLEIQNENTRIVEKFFKQLSRK